VIEENERGKMKMEYTTLDAYQAAYLTLRGLPVSYILQNGLIVFSFSETKELREALRDYMNGAEVPVFQFVTRVKMLRGQVHNRKGSSENISK